MFNAKAYLERVRKSYKRYRFFSKITNVFFQEFLNLTTDVGNTEYSDFSTGSALRYIGESGESKVLKFGQIVYLESVFVTYKESDEQINFLCLKWKSPFSNHNPEDIDLLYAVSLPTQVGEPRKTGRNTYLLRRLEIEAVSPEELAQFKKECRSKRA